MNSGTMKKFYTFACSLIASSTKGSEVKRDQKINWALVKEQIVSGVQSLYLEAKDSNPNDPIYALVITMYDDANSIGLSLNTESNHLKIIDDANLTMKENTSYYYKWYWGEWRDFEYIGDQSVLDAISSTLGSLEAKYFNERKSDESELGGEWFNSYKMDLVTSLENSLMHLDETGLFGTGDAREEITLYVGIYDSFLSEKIMKSSARKLNSQAIAEKMISEWEGQ